EDVDDQHPGQRDGFKRLEQEGLIEAFSWAAPRIIANSRGESAAQRELLEIVRAQRPNVIVQDTAGDSPLTEEWFKELSATGSRPIRLYWEGDPWGRWSKPVPPEIRLWWRQADVIFTVAIGKQRTLMERLGGRDVRFVPNTYDHILYAGEEANEPPALDG